MNRAQQISSLLAAIANCKKHGNTEWLARHTERLARQLEHMPNGNGFDSGTQLDTVRSTPERLVFTTAFHHMDENGCYDGWTDHTVTVRASLLCGLQLTIWGRDRNGIKDYIHEAFVQALCADAGQS